MRIFVLSFLFLVFSACSSDGSKTQIGSDAPIERFPAEPLELDFTFPIGQLLDDAESLTGVEVDDNGIVTFLFRNSTMARVTLAGELIDQQTLSLGEAAVDLAQGPDSALFVAGDRGSIWTVDQNNVSIVTRETSELAGLAVADNTLYSLAVDLNQLSLSRITVDGVSTKIETDPRLASYEGLAIDISDDRLFILSTDPSNQPVVLEFDTDGNFVAAWKIAGNPVALAVMDTGPRGPTLLTVDIAEEVTARQYEPPVQAGALDANALEVLTMIELGDKGLAQPSGISVYENRLYFISDFGVVASTALTGDDFQILFEIPDAIQGTFESIDVDQRGRIHILGSDESSRAVVTVYDTSGVTIEERVLLEDDTVIEGYQTQGEAAFWLNHAPGEPKVLYRLTENGVSTTPLSAEYDSLAFTGLAVTTEHLYIVADQRETPDGVLSGLILQCDLVSGAEISRYAVADESGVGVINPSGIAIAQSIGVLYVTADTDEGTVIGYDFD